MFSKILVLICALATCSVQATFPLGFRNCGSDALDAIAVSGVSMEPLSPRAGDLVKVSVTGRLLKTLTPGAQVKVTAKIGVLVVKSDILDSCDLAAKQGLGVCPLTPEQFVDELTQTVDYLVPNDVPKGVTFVLKVETVNGDGTPVSCFTGPMKIQADE